jgi:phytoene/squalene synthetase
MPATPEAHPARHLALLYSPASQRFALDALFGIERELSDSLRPGLDHHVAHSRLQWWREESERAADGRPVHPLTRALVDAVNRSPAAATAATLTGAMPSSIAERPDEAEVRPPAAATPDGAQGRSTTFAATPDEAQVAAAGAQSRARSLPQLAGLSGFVDAAVWDLAGATFETRRELTAYCERWAAAMIEPLLAPARAAPPDAPAAPASATRVNNWRALGAAMRELELLADLAREAHYGRLRVPLDELESAKVDPSVLAKPPWPAALADLLRTRHRSLRNEITRALGNVDRMQQPALRGLLVWAALTWRSSQRAERALPDQLRPGRFDAITDAWFAWRIARRATISRFRLN